MNAVLQFPITRPAFDDTNLGNESLWILDNAAALARHWQMLGRALGLDDPEGEEDIEVFCREQHAQQMREHPRFHVWGSAVRVVATMDPTRPVNQRWSAIDEDTYDGADDSPTRHQIGFGVDMEAAKRDLREQLES